MTGLPELPELPELPRDSKIVSLLKNFHPHAKAKLMAYTYEFRELLRYTAATEALLESDEQVTSTHIDAAVKEVYYKKFKVKIWQQILLFASGGLLGWALPAFFDQVYKSTTGNTDFSTVYMVVCLITVVASFIAAYVAFNLG